jgi:hypothetical protein
MTSRSNGPKRAARVSLTRRQVDSILYDMGWESEDLASFWRLARRETRHPGSLRRERVRHFRSIMHAAPGGQP